MTAALPARASAAGAPAFAPTPQPCAVPVPWIASLRRWSSPPRQPEGHLGPLNLHSQALPPSFLLWLGRAGGWGASVGCPPLHPSPGECHQGLWWAGAVAAAPWQQACRSSDPWVALSSVQGLTLPQHQPLQPRIYLEKCPDQK